MSKDESPSNEALLAEIEELRFAKTRLERTVNALKRRVKATLLQTGSSFSIFETNVQLKHELDKRKEELYRLSIAAQHTDNGVMITDVDGYLQWVNPGFTRLTEYTLEDVVGKKTGSFLKGPETDPAVSKFMNEQRKKGEGFNVEIANYTKSGKKLWLHIEAKPIIDARGVLTGFVGIQSDMTREKEALLELEEENAQKQIVLDAANAIQFDYHHFNDSFSVGGEAASDDAFGLEHSPFFNSVLIDDREHFAALLRDSNPGETFECTLRTRSHSGRARWFLVKGKASPVKFDLVSGVLIEITKQKEIEEQLTRGSRLESLGQLTSGVAHEINTPMQYIGSNLEFLQKSLDKAFDRVRQAEIQTRDLCSRELPSDDQRRIEELLRLLGGEAVKREQEEISQALLDSMDGVQAVTRIVKSMRSFARADDPEQIDVDINASIEDAISITRGRWKHVATTGVDLDPTVPLMLTFPGELNQVLLNLLVNAADAIEERYFGKDVLGSIFVSTQYDKATDSIVLTVRDNGVGIPQKILDQVFNPFFTTKAVGKGTGLGLAICHSIVVERCGGSIAINGVEGEGTTVRVTLPVSRAVTKATTDAAGQTRAPAL